VNDSGRRRRWWFDAAIVGLAITLALAPIPSDAIERWFSLGIYPRIEHVLTPITNALPFALLDVLVMAMLMGVARFGVVSVRGRGAEPLATRIFHALVRLATVVSALYIAFLLLWGFNYRRVSMAERLVVSRPAPSTDDVLMLGREAVTRMNALHATAHAQGWQGEEWRDAPLAKAFAEVEGTLSDAPKATPGRLKATLFGPYFRWTSVDGMVNPFGLEVLANPDLLPFERPFVAAHEWSHLAGYADESEANFVGWLTCLRADPPAQYSGWLFLYWQIAGEVGEKGRAQLWDAVAPGPRQDVQAVVDRLRRGQLPMLRNASWRVYDQYLKANHVDEGVRSYSEVITLILRAQFGPGWTPVRR